MRKIYLLRLDVGYHGEPVLGAFTTLEGAQSKIDQLWEAAIAYDFCPDCRDTGGQDGTKDDFSIHEITLEGGP